MSPQNNYLFGYEIHIPCPHCGYGYRTATTLGAFGWRPKECRVYSGWRTVTCIRT